MSDVIKQAEKRIEELEYQIKHLMKCKEFESDLQLDIINIGAPYIEVKKDYETYSVTDAWGAIKKELERK